MSQTHKTKPLKINQLSLPVDLSQKKKSPNQNRSALCHSANLRKRALTANMKRLELHLAQEKQKSAKGTEKMSLTVSSMRSPQKIGSSSSFSSHLKHFSLANKNNSWLNQNLSVPLHSNSKFHSYSKVAHNQNFEKCKTTNGLQTEGSKIDENNNGLAVQGAVIKKQFEYQRPKTTSLNDFVENENNQQKIQKNKQNYRNGRSRKESLNLAQNYPLQNANPRKNKRVLKVYEYKANQINLPSNFTNLLKLQQKPKAFPFCKRMSISSVSKHIQICIDEISNKKTNDLDNEKEREAQKIDVSSFVENEEHLEEKNNNENHTTISSVLSPKRNPTHYQLVANTNQNNVFPQFRTPILVATRISSKRQVSFSNEMILRMKQIDEFTKNQNGLIGFNEASNHFEDRNKNNNCAKISRAQSMKHPQKPKVNECVEEVSFGAWENLENDQGMINNF